MELNFVQSSEVFGKNTLAWETEFEATGDFNLHVERNKGGDILVYQRTAGSGYAIVEEFRGMDNKPAIDLDFTSVVYPKFVKIVSESQPTYATVTTDGEITEIKSQSKEVEVTSNGTMDITPDAGFAYLSAVKVKTNVAQSGEGGGSASSVEYIDVSGGFDDIFHKSILLTKALQIRAMTEDAGLCVASYPDIESNIGLTNIADVAQAISIDTSTPIVLGGQMLLLSDYFNAILPQIGLSIEWYNALPRITESEFYNLNA